MAPNGNYCSWNKLRFLTSKKRASNNKRTSFCPDTSTMSRSLLNKRHSLHGILPEKPCESILNWSLHGAQWVIQSWINEHHTRQPHESFFFLNWSEYGELWFLLQVNNFKHLSEKEMCQKKSKIDTTIDFVKHPKYSRINTFLNIFVPKNNLE